MHPFLAETMAGQRRVHLHAVADARRTATMAMAVGTETLRVRPIESTDADALTRLFSRLSRRSILYRFFSPIHELTAKQVAHFVEVDHRCREALVALLGDEIVAVARYDSDCRSREAEIAVTVEDRWQRRGIGKRLLDRLAQLAVAHDFDAFVARIMPENRAALALVLQMAPNGSVRWDDGEYRVSIPLA